MRVYLNEVSGIADAIVSMYISKRTLTEELESHIRDLAHRFTDRRGFLITDMSQLNEESLESMASDYEEFQTMISKCVKWGQMHTTMLRFIDLSFMVYGLHRAGQDDWDAHACRFNNRIIRSSTRLATFADEMSDYYEGKIMTTDQMLKELHMGMPNMVLIGEKRYARTTNGYILEEEQDNKDVKRGLYMLSIPSNFIFRVNLTEFSHVYKERNANSHANPEVKELAETIADLLESAYPQFTRELLLAIKN